MLNKTTKQKFRPWLLIIILGLIAWDNDVVSTEYDREFFIWAEENVSSKKNLYTYVVSVLTLRSL